MHIFMQVKNSFKPQKKYLCRFLGNVQICTDGCKEIPLKYWIVRMKNRTSIMSNNMSANFKEMLTQLKWLRLKNQDIIFTKIALNLCLIIK